VHSVSEDLIRFVKQADDVSNAKWFLRNIEWKWSLRCIGPPSYSNCKILDVASEVRVSNALFEKGWNVWRVDFSLEAAKQAKKFGPVFSGHLVIDSQKPHMPFPKDSFEAAISIGPFDFRFLDTDKLLAESRSLLKDNGRFVFSLPTPKSPYCNNLANSKFRFWSADDIADIIRNWTVGAIHRINIPQPSWIYSRFGNTSRIPYSLFNAIVTKPFYHLCPFVPDDMASYVILSFGKSI
jgi:SAM-dependent methyltransferase